MKLLPILLTAMIAIAGCDRDKGIVNATVSQPAPIPTIDSLNGFASRFAERMTVENDLAVREFIANSDVNPKVKGDILADKRMSDIYKVLSTDIKKTNSVVRPYVGEVVLRQTSNHSRYIADDNFLFAPIPATGGWELIRGAALTKAQKSDPYDQQVVQRAVAGAQK